MNAKSAMVWLLAMSALAAGGLAAAQTRTDLGKREFLNNCVVCHDHDAKGGGVLVPYLVRKPPDLTVLQQRNGGVFPVTRVYEVIEGAGMSHGARDMPVWGNEYLIQAGEYYIDVPYNPEAYVRGRILALTEYLSRLQAK